MPRALTQQQRSQTSVPSHAATVGRCLAVGSNAKEPPAGPPAGVWLEQVSDWTPASDQVPMQMQKSTPATNTHACTHALHACKQVAEHLAHPAKTVLQTRIGVTTAVFHPCPSPAYAFAMVHPLTSCLPAACITARSWPHLIVPALVPQGKVSVGGH